MLSRTISNVRTSLDALHATRAAAPSRWVLTRLAVRDEEGVVTAEYAILLALVAMAAIAAFIVLGLAVAHLFDTGTAGIPHA